MRLISQFLSYFILAGVIVGVGGQVHHENDDRRDDYVPTREPDIEEQCGLYLAESSVRNGGWGVFVGKEYQFGEKLGDSNGGLGIPVLHVDGINDDGNIAEFLVNPAIMGGFSEGRRVAQFLPGIYPLINYDSQLANVLEGGLTRTPTFRRVNPMAGANTDYHGFHLKARNHLPAGSELFLEASPEWYKDAGIPTSNMHKRAGSIHRHLLKYDESHPELTEVQWVDILHRIKNEMLTTNDAGLAKLIPKERKELHLIRDRGLSQWSLHQRNLEWLKKEGKCLDNIRAGESTIVNAGRGAFATRRLPKGSLVTPAPLLHINDRSQLFLSHNKGHNSTLQLMINYCFGHRYSDILLCPTTNAALINHHRQKVNAEIRWSKASQNRVNSEVDPRLEGLEELFVGKAGNGKYNNNTRLMMDIVAIRDIDPGEEIFLNYGDEWENAFERHTKQWRAPPSYDYKPTDLLKQEENAGIKLSNDPSLVYHSYECRAEPMAQENRLYEVEEEYRSNPNIDPSQWTPEMAALYGNNDFICWYPCEIKSDNGDGTYRANLYSKQKTDASKIRMYLNIPASAIRLTDRPYQSDMHLPRAFRYYIPIPDEMFPLRWRNDYKISDTLHLGSVSRGVEINQEIFEEHEARVRKAKCGVYFAPSNIPSAGFGTYTAVPLAGRGITVGTSMPVVPLYNKFPEKWNGDDYVWNGITYNVEYESSPHIQTAVMAVNDGALANSFIGLVNEYVEPSIFDPILDRCADPGAGAFSDYIQYSFKNEFMLGAGEELFVSYGENWFIARSQFGDVPMTQNWIDANRIVASLYRLAKLDGASLDEGQIVDLLQVAKHALTNEHRTKMALATAESLSKIEHIVERNGTAQATVESRSLEWFEENGQCIDHIYVKPSTIKQAGQGAFASDRVDGGMKPNAELRWATWNKKSSYYLERTLEDLKKESYSTMVLDVVATRDIGVDEEVFIDYGIEWEKSWIEHVKNWESPCTPETKSSLEVKRMNHNDQFNSERFKWTDEIMTLCVTDKSSGRWIHVVEGQVPTDSHNEVVVKQFSDVDYNHDGWKIMMPDAFRLPCRILSADIEKKTFDVVIFTDHASRLPDAPGARVLIRKSNLPLANLVFMHKPFKSDMHLTTAFRQAVNIPDNIFPSQWKDLI